jgi:hypothetical protein
MNLQKRSLIIAIAVPLLVPGNALAEDRTSTGYLSAVTSRSLVMDGVSYRFHANREEKNPVRVQCTAEGKKIGCEELAQINPQNRAKAKVSFDSAGFVTRVQILDVLK